MTLECPICGADSKADGTPFPDESSVASHISASRGEHKGIGYPKALNMVQARNTVQGDTQPDTDDAGSDTVQDTDSDMDAVESGDSDSDNPVTDGPEPEEDNNDSGGHGGETCPKCGEGELIDARNHNLIELPNGEYADAPDEYYCNNFRACGTGFNDE